MIPNATEMMMLVARKNRMNFSLSENEKMKLAGLFFCLRMLRWQISEAQMRYGKPMTTIVMNWLKKMFADSIEKYCSSYLSLMTLTTMNAAASESRMTMSMYCTFL